MVEEPPHGLLLGWTEPPSKHRRSAFPEHVWGDADEGHLITVAPTGAGKGVSCIIPALLSWRGPAIVIDPKGENYAVTARRRREMGHSVHVLDPFGVTGAHPAALNPLDIVSATSESYQDDQRAVANLMIQGLVFRNDPFWDERATALIMAAIAYVVEGLGTPTLRDVRTVIDTFAEIPALARYCQQPITTYAHPCIHKDFAPVGMGVDKTRYSIAATACSHMSFIHQGAVAASLGPTSFSLDAVWRGGPITLYLVLPPDKLQTHSKLLRLWLGVLLRVLTQRCERPPMPTLLLVDEAAQLGPLDELRTAITLLRGYGVRVWSFWQDLAQLRRTYPEDWESLLNNCSTHQYFGAMTPMAMRSLEEYLCDCLPRPVQSLKPNQIATIRPRHGASILRAPDYRHDLLFRGHYGANPFHMPRLALLDPHALTEDRAASGATVLPFPSKQAR